MLNSNASALRENVVLFVSMYILKPYCFLKFEFSSDYWKVELIVDDGYVLSYFFPPFVL